MRLWMFVQSFQVDRRSCI